MVWGTFWRSRRKKLLNPPKLSCGFNTMTVFTRRQSAIFWIVIRDAHLESRFEIQYFRPCVRQITSRFVIWDAHLKSQSRGVFELRISNHESRRDLAYTRSQIPYFESWFKMRISNHDSKYGTLPSCENSQSLPSKDFRKKKLEKKNQGECQKKWTVTLWLPEAKSEGNLIPFHIHISYVHMQCRS